MQENFMELEAKFLVNDLEHLEKEIVQTGGVCVQERVHELNLRFDNPEGDLRAARQVLRLRQDTKAWLTYKGMAEEGAEVSTRQEIEFEVSNFEAAKRFLQALGYHVCVMYEKYRRVYSWRGLHVMLDELPIGRFIEIEGPDAEAIRRVADELELNWDARCAASYLELFNRLRSRINITARHLCFEALKDASFTPADFDVTAADQSI